jgi:hypothetical protein
MIIETIAAWAGRLKPTARKPVIKALGEICLKIKEFFICSDSSKNLPVRLETKLIPALG